MSEFHLSNVRQFIINLLYTLYKRFISECTMHLDGIKKKKKQEIKNRKKPINIHSTNPKV